MTVEPQTPVPPRIGPIARTRRSERRLLWLLIGVVVVFVVVMCCLPFAWSYLNTAGREAGWLPTYTPKPTEEPTPTRTATLTPAPSPTPTITLTPSPVPTVETSTCRLGISYVADVTVPDNTAIELGTAFTKTWRVRNTGTCAWGGGYSLQLVSGESMGGSTITEIPATEPGQETELSVALVAPETAGRYRGDWQLCVNETECFGQKLYVQIVAQPPATKVPTATSTPNTAGVTDWLRDEGQQVGVREIEWSYRLGYYRPEQGKIFVSLYIIAVNVGQSEETFWCGDYNLVDGGGEINGELIFEQKEPSCQTCTVKPGGVCEGWWTTSIWDREEVKKNLVFRWSPGFLGPTLETRIRQ